MGIHMWEANYANVDDIHQATHMTYATRFILVCSPTKTTDNKHPTKNKHPTETKLPKLARMKTKLWQSEPDSLHLPEIRSSVPQKGHLFKSQLSNSNQDLISIPTTTNSNKQFEQISFSKTLHMYNAQKGNQTPRHHHHVGGRKKPEKDWHGGTKLPSLAPSQLSQQGRELTKDHFLFDSPVTDDQITGRHGKTSKYKPDCFCPRCEVVREEWSQQAEFRSKDLGMKYNKNGYSSVNFEIRGVEQKMQDHDAR